MEALRDFEGTMLFVSHDRTFLRGLSNRVLELGGESGTRGGAAPLPRLLRRVRGEDRARGARRPRLRGQILNCALAWQGTIQDLTPFSGSSCVRCGRYDPPVTTAADLDGGLARLGYEAFRPGQREAIETLLEKGRLLLVAPTGGGKSLIYQLPASLLPGTSLVISPLVSLMHDQVQALEARGVPATFLAATLSAAEMRERLGAAARGRLQARLRRAGAARLPRLPGARARPRRAARRRRRGPLHQRVGPRLPPRLPRRSARLLAELRPRARAGLHRDRHAGRARRDPRAARPRPRHAADAARLRAPQPRAARARRRLRARARRGRWTRSSAEALGAPGRRARDARSSTRRPAGRRRRRPPGSRPRGWRAAGYHAGLAGETRTRVQRAFADGALEVVVATNAFGMGIDRADVRAVVHLAPPGLGRGLLPGGRARRARRAGGLRPAAALARRPAAAPAAARAAAAASRRGPRWSSTSGACSST